MKSLRYRIRIITLLLVCAMVFLSLIIVRSSFFPSGIVFNDPENTHDPTFSALPESTYTTPSGQWPPLLIDDVTPAPESFFDTSGL